MYEKVSPLLVDCQLIITNRGGGYLSDGELGSILHQQKNHRGHRAGGLRSLRCNEMASILDKDFEITSSWVFSALDWADATWRIDKTNSRINYKPQSDQPRQVGKW